MLIRPEAGSAAAGCVPPPRTAHEPGRPSASRRAPPAVLGRGGVLRARARVRRAVRGRDDRARRPGVPHPAGVQSGARGALGRARACVRACAHAGVDTTVPHRARASKPGRGARPSALSRPTSVRRAPRDLLREHLPSTARALLRQAEKQLLRVLALDPQHVHALTLSGLMHFKARGHPPSQQRVGHALAQLL